MASNIPTKRRPANPLASKGSLDKRMGATAFYLRERIIHWRSRNKWLHDKVSIENLQRVLAALTLIIGAFFALTGNAGKDATLIMTAPDAGFTWIWPWLFHRIRPHQFLGIAAFYGSVVSMIALLNWPVISEAESRDDESFDKDYLRKLLSQQKVGTLTCAAFWGVLFVAAFVSHPSPGPLLCLFAAYVHHWVYIRVSKQYAQDRDRSYQEKRYRKFGYPYRGA